MNPIDAYQSLYTALQDTPAAPLLHTLQPLLDSAFSAKRNGKLPVWLEAIAKLPRVDQPSLVYENKHLCMAGGESYSTEINTQLETCLRTFHPWRKGPLNIANTVIDTEWHSDWKWDRVQPGITPLTGRKVLDIGCGNGYHCWRMLQGGAEWVIGIDPTLLFVMQFLACKHFAGDLPVWVLPLGIEDLPGDLPVFDSVFSMGVLYHRRSPLDHLFDLQRLLRPAGELVLETLVVDGEVGYSLLPPGRYAQMRNVWFLPGCATLIGWMERCGFVDVRLIDIRKTTTDEQRSTDWMQFQSLADFLDPDDHNKTIEGHPAPVRAVFVANKKK